MEELKSYLFNLDFEELLRSHSYEKPNWKTINGELEHLFFWLSCPDECLYTLKSYSDDFLEYIQSFRGHRPLYSSSNQNYRCWWGQLDNESFWQRERLLNSKVETAINRSVLGIEKFPVYICHDEREVKEAIGKIDDEFVIKEEFNFSGKGLSFGLNHRIRNFPVIVEKWVKRIRDFSVYISDNDFYVSQSHISPTGAYKGSQYKEKFGEFDLIQQEAQKIWSFYKSKYSADFLQIDMFQYLDGPRLILNALGEINHRMSLGRVFYRVQKDYGSSYSFMAMIPTRTLKKDRDFSELISDFKRFQYNPVTKRGAICLSPLSGKFSLIFFSEESERSLQFLIRDWWKEVVGPNEKLPAEFIVYL